MKFQAGNPILSPTLGWFIFVNTVAGVFVRFMGTDN
jgi:hypothetical protein